MKPLSIKKPFGLLIACIFFVTTNVTGIVCAEEWYESYITSLKQEGIISRDNVTPPETPLTNEELIKIIVNAAYKIAPISFSEKISQNGGYYDYVKMAKALKMFRDFETGTEDAIRERPVTRAEAAKMIVNAFEIPISLYPPSIFPDVPVGHPYYSAIVSAYNQSVLDGYQDGNFGPDAPVTLAHMSKLIFNARRYSPRPIHKDNDKMGNGANEDKSNTKDSISVETDVMEQGQAEKEDQEINETVQVVTLSEIKGILPPATREIPVFEIGENEEYTGLITWSPFAQVQFNDNEVYTATIRLKPKAGYTFEGVPKDFFSVEGALSTKNDQDSSVVTAVFPITLPIAQRRRSSSITSPVATFNWSGTGSKSFVVRGTNTSSVNINWGDGSDDDYTLLGSGSDASCTHSYASTPNTVTISGDIEAISHFIAVNKGISSISFENLTNLIWLELTQNTSISTLSSLAGLTNLESLYLDETGTTDISILSNLTNLNYISAETNSITTLPASFPAWSGSTISFKDNSFSSSIVDQTVDKLYSAGISNSTIDLSGTNSGRTSASDTAYDWLINVAQGNNTVTINNSNTTISDVDSDENISPSQTNVILTGTGFRATQSTGKLELANNANYSSATIKVAQSIDSWSDTSIQFDVVQGGLSGGTIYAFVTNHYGGINNVGYPIVLNDPPLVMLLGRDWSTLPGYGEFGNTHQLTPYTALKTGLIKELRVYGKANGNVKFGLYDDTGSTYPGNLLYGDDSGQAIANSQWNTYAISSDVNIEKDSPYYMGGNANASAIGADFISGYTEITYSTDYSSFVNPDPLPAGKGTYSGWANSFQAWGYALATITDVDGDENITSSQTNVVVTGSDFVATQGLGKVELANNVNYSAATVKVSQSIDSWSDTSIQFDTAQGGLSTGTVYMFITNQYGQVNASGYPITLSP